MKAYNKEGGFYGEGWKPAAVWVEKVNKQEET